MMSPAPSSSLQLGRARDWWLGALLLLALVVGVQWWIGWATLLEPWRTFSPLALVWLFVMTALSYALRAVRVHDYFRSRFSGQFLGVLRLSVLHNTANNLLPMRSGELVFPWLMRRYFGFDLLEAGASLIWIRLLDLHCLGLVGLVLLWLAQPSPWWWLAALVWLAGLVLAVRLAPRLAAGLAPRGRLGRLAGRLLEAAPRERGVMARVYLWTMLTWTLKFIAFATVLQHFLGVDWWRVLAGVMGAELSSVLPFHGVAGSGSYELAAVAALVPLGVEPSRALAGAVNLHLFLLGSTLVLGVLALLLPRPKLSQNHKNH